MADSKISLLPSLATAADDDLLAIVDTSATETKKIAKSDLVAGLQAELVSGTNIKTINSTSLLGSGDITISGGSPAGTAGQIQFTDGSAFAADSNLFWDNTNKRLGVGTSSPSYGLDVSQDISGNLFARLRNTNSSGFGMQLNAGSGLSTYTLQWGNYFGGSGGRIYPEGVIVGTQSAPTARLQVRGTGATSATTSLLVQNSSGQQLLSCRDDGFIGIGTTSGGFICDAGGPDKIRATSVGVGIEGGPVSTASLAVNSTTKGFLPPRMTTTQKNAISTPAAGLQLWDTDTSSLQVTNGTDWLSVGFGAGGIGTNSVLGNGALDANTTGNENTAVGNSALGSNTSGIRNTAVGFEAALSNTTGASNTAIGSIALTSNTTGGNNVGIGRGALRSNQTSSSSVAIGVNALFSNTASNNTAVGFEAANANTSGVEITAVGYQALRSSTGGYNTAVGFKALTANTTGIANTGFGDGALLTNTTGISNTAIGTGSLTSVNANANTAVGRDSLRNNTASNNTAVGYEAAYSNTSGVSVTALGYQALRVSTGNSNTAIGYQAGVAITTGASNTAVGSQAMLANQNGLQNTAIGQEALPSTFSGSYNSCVGYKSLSGNTTASSNTSIGHNTNSGNFSGSVILGRDATANGNNQFVVGSAGYNAGTIDANTFTQGNRWKVKINGTDYWIPLELA